DVGIAVSVLSSGHSPSLPLVGPGSFTSGSELGAVLRASGADSCPSSRDGHRTPMSTIASMTTTKPAAIFQGRPNGFEFLALSVMSPHPFFHRGCYTNTAMMVPAAV